MWCLSARGEIACKKAHRNHRNGPVSPRTQLTRNEGLTYPQCWASVNDAGPASRVRWPGRYTFTAAMLSPLPDVCFKALYLSTFPRVRWTLAINTVITVTQRDGVPQKTCSIFTHLLCDKWYVSCSLQKEIWVEIISHNYYVIQARPNSRRALEMSCMVSPRHRDPKWAEV